MCDQILFFDTAEIGLNNGSYYNIDGRGIGHAFKIQNTKLQVIFPAPIIQMPDDKGFIAMKDLLKNSQILIQ